MAYLAIPEDTLMHLVGEGDFTLGTAVYGKLFCAMARYCKGGQG